MLIDPMHAASDESFKVMSQLIINITYHEVSNTTSSGIRRLDPGSDIDYCRLQTYLCGLYYGEWDH